MNRYADKHKGLLKNFFKHYWFLTKITTMSIIGIIVYVEVNYMIAIAQRVGGW